MPEFQLRDYQKQGVKFLRDMDGIAALLYEPGVGKTGTTLGWIDRQVHYYGEMRVLVVAPLTAADTWVLQPEKFMDTPTKARMLSGSTEQILKKLADARDWTTVPNERIMRNHNGSVAKQVSGNRVTILSMSSGAISSFCRERPKTVRMIRAVAKFAPHLIVVDESHLIKAHDSNVSKAMYQLGQLAPHRIILTGTVNPLGPLDCYGQWRFLAPWTFSDAHGEEFTKTPLTMTEEQKKSIHPWPIGRMKARYTIKGGFKGKGIKDYQNIDTPGGLNDRVAERSQVLLKKDVLSLPPVTDMDIHIQLSTREQKAYDEMREDLAAQMADGSLLEVPNALAKIMKLRQIHAGFVKNTETGEVFQIGNTLRKAATEIVNVQLAGENRIVVFGYFKTECAEMVKALTKPGRTVELVTGSTPASERLAIRQRFADTTAHPEPTVLVAQQRTMSLSVNELVTAQHAVYCSMSERRDDWVQSRGRLDRSGQALPVTFWNCYAPALIGEVMLNNHKERGNMETALLNHIRMIIR